MNIFDSRNNKTLDLPVIQKEKLSVFTFGNKNPIEKTYEIKLTTLKLVNYRK